MIVTEQREPLTTRQREVYSFIVSFNRRECRPPAYSEIMQRFKFKSKNAVSMYLRVLEMQGWIELTKTIKASKLHIKIISRPDECWCCGQKVRRKV